MKNVTWFTMLLMLFVTANEMLAQCFTCDDAPPGTFFCDDFESTSPLTDRYFEVDDDAGDLIVMNDIGRDGGRALRVLWQQGEVGAGGLHKSFGKTPSNYIGQHAENPDSSYDEIYWRMDVRHQPDWQGNGPAKLSRALVFLNYNWAEGMMAHMWSGGSNDFYLLSDPASGIDTNGVITSTKYNDFDNLRWLGYKIGTTPMFADANTGKWYCVIAHVKLNTPGKSDGIFEFWINDTLQSSVRNMNWHGTYNAAPNTFKINAVFFENYWNAGSPKEQERYFDNLVISTQPIPCVCDATTGIIDKSTTREIEVSNVRYFDLMGREIDESEIQRHRVLIEVKTNVSGQSKSRLIAY